MFHGFNGASEPEHSPKTWVDAWFLFLRRLVDLKICRIVEDFIVSVLEGDLIYILRP